MRRPLALFMVSYMIGMTVLCENPRIFIFGLILWVFSILFVYGWSSNTIFRLALVFAGLVLGASLAFMAESERPSPFASESHIEAYGYAVGPDYGKPGRLVVDVRRIGSGTDMREANGRILIISDGDLSKYRHSYVRYEGLLTREQAPSNPNAFDYVQYARLKGYDGVGFYDGAGSLTASGAEKFYDPLRIKDEILEKSGKILDVGTQAYFASLVFGDTSLMEAEQYRQVGLAGLSHLFAVSGLHIAILYGFLKMVSKFFFKRNHWLPSVVLLSILLLFISIIGFPVSAVRAFVFIAILSLSKLARRKYDLLNALLLAAFLVLAANPHQLFSAGFQLSFGAVASIHFIYPAVKRRMPSDHAAVKAFAVSLAVQIGIAPLILYHFNYISLISIFANVPAVLFIGLLLPALYVFAVSAGLGIPFLTPFLAYGAKWGIFLLDAFSRGVVRFPGIFSDLPFVGAGGAALYYCILSLLVVRSGKEGFLNYRRLRNLAILSVATVFVLWIPAKALQENRLEITFFDVGQGDSILIQTPGNRTILVDGGSANENLGDLLLKNGIGRIDLAVLTHYHEDHYGGLVHLAETGRIKEMILKETAFENEEIRSKLEAAVKKSGNAVSNPEEGEKMILGGCSIEIANVGQVYGISDSNSAENNDSLVLLVDYKNFELLLTGDMEREAEARLTVANGKDVDVLKAAHHGSKTSNTEVFAEVFKPEAVVVQVGPNFFGHPNPSVLETYRNLGADLFRTDEDGAVMIRTDGIRQFGMETYYSHRREIYELE